MKSYVSQLLEERTVWTMNDTRKIITDRMGTWEEQNVVLVWEGDADNKRIQITPDEAEILYEKGLLKNVARSENGKLYLKTTFADIRQFDGAIVCGVLAPSTSKTMRQEIKDYAMKKGYITNAWTPASTLFNGTKALVDSNNTYSIVYFWNRTVIKDIGPETLKQFTINYFENSSIEIRDDAVVQLNLSEKEVFSRENIDKLRVYDIQLSYLSSSVDKELLLRALMLKAFMLDFPCNILKSEIFKKNGKIRIPEDRQDSINFNEFGRKKMQCGTVYRNLEYKHYRYQIDVPYKETIRVLMSNYKEVMNRKYSTFKIHFDFFPFDEQIYVCFGENEWACSEIERDFIALDYAMKFLQEESKLNDYQLYSSIISLLEADCSGQYRYEYFSYLNMLKNTFPDKCI